MQAAQYGQQASALTGQAFGALGTFAGAALGTDMFKKSLSGAPGMFGGGDGLSLGSAKSGFSDILNPNRFTGGFTANIPSSNIFPKKYF